jgi:OmcA/MtrC family decaheme c-type cytochrome
VNASGQPVFVFKITKDGSAVTSFNAPTMPTTGKIAVPGTFEAITGFQSGPSFYVAYAVPQDGITAPSDFNTYQSVSLSNLLVASGSPKGGTLTGPDGSGYWTATLTGDTVGQPVATGCALDTVKATAGWCIPKSPIKIPATAKMVTGAMIGTFKQGVFTGVNQTTLAAQYNFTNGSKSKGLILKSPLKKMVAKDSTGVAYTARRVAVDVDKCESCHEQLGTAVEFHSGARNDPTACAICHNTSRTSNGWSANASTFIHGIHAGTAPAVAKAIDASASLAAAVGSAGTGTNAGVGGAGATFAEGKRNVPFSWARSGSFNAAASKYPGVLKRCDNCHVRNAVNFGTTDGAAAVPGMLWSTSATNSVSSAGALTLFNGATETTKMYPRDPINGSSTNNYVTYITADGVKNYGNVFNYVPEGSTVSKYYSSGSTTAIAPAVAGAGGAVIPADPETLVESPMTSACFACHDSSTAKNHMKLNGGVIYGRRGDYVVNGVLENKEACLTCHGLSKPYDSAIVHAK